MFDPLARGAANFSESKGVPYDLKVGSVVKLVPFFEILAGGGAANFSDSKGVPYDLKVGFVVKLEPFFDPLAGGAVNF
ncbi:hypothetical protein ACHAXA_002192 [Cyclostephanos tholiformis]|uniref:Uncharacterized protein n=1 Tax=Cyclostephanos tholiformis TaxID=382380 RepID=A0ABD3RVK2_9STRA